MPDMRVEVSDAAPEFFADDVTVSHTPLRFVIDFKSITPRVNMPASSRHMVLKHNIIKVEPFMAKTILDILTNNIQRYEKEYGKITKPKQVEKAEKLMKKDQKTDKKANIDSPLHSYVG